MKFENAVNKIKVDKNMVFMSETGKRMKFNENDAVVYNKCGEDITSTSKDNFTIEDWNELFVNKKTFNQLLDIHTIKNDVEFQVKHFGQEQYDFESRTIKYFLNTFLIELAGNYSNSETALILGNVEFFVK